MQKNAFNISKLAQLRKIALTLHHAGLGTTMFWSPTLIIFCGRNLVSRKIVFLHYSHFYKLLLLRTLHSLENLTQNGSHTDLIFWSSRFLVKTWQGEEMAQKCF